MAVDFTKTFGSAASAAVPASGSSASERPTAQLWLNVGYNVDMGDGTKRFVSLPVGIPVDTQNHIKIQSRNAEYADFQTARNDLLDQILAAAAQLAPGEDVTLNLEIQLRRVEGERPQPTMTEGNAFARPAGAGSLVA